MYPIIIEEHYGINILRDDILVGGTKSILMKSIINDDFDIGFNKTFDLDTDFNIDLNMSFTKYCNRHRIMYFNTDFILTSLEILILILIVDFILILVLMVIGILI